MAKAIFLDAVEMAMLQELAKQSRLRPEQYLKNLIQSQYGTIKRP